MAFMSCPRGPSDVFYCYWIPQTDKWFGIFWKQAATILEIPERRCLFPKSCWSVNSAVGPLFARIAGRSPLRRGTTAVRIGQLKICPSARHFILLTVTSRAPRSRPKRPARSVATRPTTDDPDGGSNRGQRGDYPASPGKDGQAGAPA